MPGAVASVAGAVVGGLGAKKAAGVQQRSSAEASRVGQQIQADALTKQEGNIKPYTDAGAAATGRLSTGVASGGEFTQPFTMKDFMANKDPSSDFMMQEGQKALERSQAAKGTINTGGAAKALTRYAQGFASTEFGNAYNRFIDTRQKNFSNLAQIAGNGLNATGSINSSIQRTGEGMAETATSGILGVGNAEAGGINGITNSITGAINGSAGMTGGGSTNLAAMMAGTTPTPTAAPAGWQNIGAQMPWVNPQASNQAGGTAAVNFFG